MHLNTTICARRPQTVNEFGFRFPVLLRDKGCNARQVGLRVQSGFDFFSGVVFLEEPGLFSWYDPLLFPSTPQANHVFIYFSFVCDSLRVHFVHVGIHFLAGFLR